MNRYRRNIAMTLAILAGFLFVGQAIAQQNRNAGSGKKTQQSQIAKQKPGTPQANQTKQSQLPQQQPQAGRSVSKQPATQQRNSTGNRGPTTGSPAIPRSVPSAASGNPGPASAAPQTGKTQNPLNSPSRGAISPNRGSSGLTGRTESAPNAGNARAVVPTNPPANNNSVNNNSSTRIPVRSPDASRSEQGNNSNANLTPRAIEGTPASQLIGAGGRTALEVYGEQTLREIGLPEELWNVDAKTALHQGRQKLIRDKYGIPKDITQNMAPEDMLNAVANLALFDAEEHVNSPKFWNDVSSGGLNVALGPIVSDNLGLPAGVRAGSPASKVLEDAGQLQVFDLDLGDRGSWTLLNEFQNGKLTTDQFVDRVNQIKSGRNGSGRGTVGGAHSGNNRGGAQSPNSRPGTDGPDVGGLGGTLPGGQGSSGNSTSPTDAASNPNSPPASDSNTTPPGSRGGDTGGRGTAPGTDSTDSTPPGSQNSTTPAPGGSNSESNSGTEQSDSTAGAPGSGDKKSKEVSGPTVVGVTYESTGGATWVATVYSDGTYVNTLVDNETGEVLRTEKGKTQDNSEPDVIEVDSSDSSTTNDDADVETGDADVDTTDVDEYTPGRDGEYIMPLAERLKYMQSLIQALDDTKWNPSKGGTDSTPNPMNESFGGGAVPWNPKDSVVRPVDGTSFSDIIPAEAIQQIQDPNGVQGGVINPVKNKDNQ